MRWSYGPLGEEPKVFGEDVATIVNGKIQMYGLNFFDKVCIDCDILKLELSRLAALIEPPQ